MTLIKRLKSNTLINDIATVASGTTIAQIITFLLTPIITRMYGPNTYGILGTFTSIVGILGIFSALSYPQAIVLPKNETKAQSLTKVSIVITLFLGSLVFFIILFFRDIIIELFNLHSISSYLLLFPLFMIFTGVNETFKQVNIRHKEFKTLAFIPVIYTLVKTILKVVLGTIYPTASTLIVISTFSIFLQNILYIFKTKKTSVLSEIFTFKISKKDVSTALEYRDFPLYRAPQTIFNSVSQNFPVILLTTLFGPAMAGFYSLSKSVLNVPTLLIGQAIGNTLYPRLSERYNNKLPIKQLLIKSTFTLALIGLLPFGIIIIFGPILFELVFGSSWYIAGHFARWMSVWLYFMFINRPAVVAIPILKLQKEFLWYEIVTTLIKVSGLFLGAYIFADPLLAIILFSILGGISYIILIFRVISKAK